MSIARISSPNDSDRYANLRPVRAILRSDLQITRQVYQGEPVYVVHDPVSFASHRLPLETYRIVTLLGPETSLGDVFEIMVSEGEFERDEEHEFYGLLSQLFHNGLLILPFHDGNKLFASHERMTSLFRRGRLRSVLFMTVPLSNPDAFLTRTAPRLKWMFTRTFFFVWILFGLAAGGVMVSRFTEFLEPLNGILAYKNLPFLWGSLILLKIWHELGHGYACKVFGGRVPEMGTILIAGNPLAYVDASSAWSFPEKRRRLIVMLGGMFFESLVAIPAVFIWASTTNPLLQSCTYNLIFTATVVTLLFNINPLMKFDGYFIMSELMGIQNLRARSTAQIHGILKRVFLGLPMPEEQVDIPFRRKFVFVTYGIASSIYRCWLIVSISLMVAKRFFLLGIGMAALYIFGSLFSVASKLAKYLLTHPETEPIRWRARFVCAAVLCGLPAALCLCKVPFGVVTDGIVAAENEHYVRIETAGEFMETRVRSGDKIDPGAPLATLQNAVVSTELAVAEARLREAELAWEIARDRDVVESTRMEARIGGLRSQLHEMQFMNQNLSPVSPGAGEVVRTYPASELGAFLQPGTPIAVIVDGAPLLRVWLNEEQLRTIACEVGQRVDFRLAGRSLNSFKGKIARINPAAEEVFVQQALTFMGGGEILVDPQTGKPLEPLFLVEIRPDSDSAVRLADHGARVSLRFERSGESIARWALRNCLRFLQNLRLA